MPQLQYLFVLFSQKICTTICYTFDKNVATNCNKWDIFFQQTRPLSKKRHRNFHLQKTGLEPLRGKIVLVYCHWPVWWARTQIVLVTCFQNFSLLKIFNSIILSELIIFQRQIFIIIFFYFVCQLNDPTLPPIEFEQQLVQLSTFIIFLRTHTPNNSKS